MQIVVNKLLTQYEKQGSGPVALFLHGWGDDHRSFLPLIAELKSTHTCIAVDLPGSGGSQTPQEAWGVPEYAAFVKAFLNKLKLKPSVVVGHSNGGTVSMYLTAHQLIETESLVLLASAGIRSEESARKLAYKIVAKIGKHATKILPHTLQHRARHTLYKTAGSDILIAPHLEETFKKVVRYDIQKDAHRITIPTLLLYADDDTATPPRYGERLKRTITRSRLEILNGGGHFVQLTHTKKVAQLMQDFLQ